MTVKPNLHPESTQDTEPADTIFLHKCNNTWAACGDSALLLKHHFTPAFLRLVTADGVKTPYAVWNGTATIQHYPEIETFQFSSDQPDRMTVRCVFSSADVTEG